MVGRSYMSRDGGAPSHAKTAFDQTLVPALIDAAGDIEAVLERVAIRTRQSPAYRAGGGIRGWSGDVFDAVPTPLRRYPAVMQGAGVRRLNRRSCRG